MTFMWYVYILEAHNKSLYTGITKDLSRRMAQHEAGRGAKFTRGFGFQKLRYTEAVKSMSAALKREHEIKTWSRMKKLALITSKGV